MFTGIKLTNKGAEMLAAAHHGGTMSFTRVQIGSGSLTDGTSEQAVTALVEPVCYLPIAEASRSGSETSIMFQVINRDITAEFAFREIGLFAVDDGGIEYLYAYSNAGDDAETIPLPSVTTIDYIMSLKLTISNEIDVTVEIDDTLVFATKEDVAKCVKQTDVIDIEHGGTGATTAAEARNALGLGNTSGPVPVANGGTGADTAEGARYALGITVENIGAAASVHGHELTSVNITGILPIGKGGTGATDAATARSRLGVTPSNIGAATTNHTHDLTSPYISGTLPVTKGGTGATTAAEARTALGINVANLGAATADHIHNFSDDALKGTVSIAKGGTGANDAATARANLGITPENIGAATSDHSHALTDSAITGTLSIGKGGTGAADAAKARENLGITPANIGAAESSHTHNYAGSSNAGGAAMVSESCVGIITEGTGAAYTATVAGITGLAVGVSFIMIPHVVSTSTTPTLNVNGLGAKQIRRYSSMGTSGTTAGYNVGWLNANKPVRVIYNGSFWVAEGITQPNVYDLSAPVPVSKGGTGGTTTDEARSALGIDIRSIGLNESDLTAHNAVESGASALEHIFTADGDGVYLIGVNVVFDNSSVGFRRVRIATGTLDAPTILAEVTQRPIENLSHAMQCVVAHYLEDGESVDFHVYQSSGSTLALKSRTWVVKLHPGMFGS